MGRRSKHSRRAISTVQHAVPSNEENAQHESETHLCTTQARASQDTPHAQEDPYQVFTFDNDILEDVNELIDTNIPAGVSTSTLHPTLRYIHELVNDKIGLAHAVKIVLREVTHPHLVLQIYEAGILLCISAFIVHAKADGSLRSLLDSFPPVTAVRLVGFATRLQLFMKRASSVAHYVPNKLSLKILPADANTVWNTERARVVQAISSIDLETREEEGRPDWHANAIVFLFEKSINQPRVAITCIKKMEVTVPLKCGVCFDVAEPSDVCNAETECKYLICGSCRQRNMSNCPFCRTPWL